MQIRQVVLAKRPQTPAERKALQRARTRRGIVPVRVDVDCQTIETLINIGWLTDEESHDRARVAAALGEALQLWARGVA